MYGLTLGLSVDRGRRAAADPGPADYTPVADFTASPLNGGAPLFVKLTDTSETFGQAVTGRVWGWSTDGLLFSASFAESPTIELAAGSWIVSLEVTTSVGTDTETKVGYVTVTAFVPSLDFSDSRNSMYAGSIL